MRELKFIMLNEMYPHGLLVLIKAGFHWPWSKKVRENAC